MRSMATFTPLSLQTGKYFPASKQAVLAQVQRAEKKNFPRHESFDFESELRKRNVELVAVLNEDTSGPILIAYLIFVHAKPGNFVWLHKICVLEQFRRQNTASTMLKTMAERYKGRGCSKIQLWVDEQNLPARGLYEGAGFQDVNKVEDYYTPGRTGIRMALHLLSP